MPQPGRMAVRLNDQPTVGVSGITTVEPRNLSVTGTVLAGDSLEIGSSLHWSASQASGFDLSLAVAGGRTAVVNGPACLPDTRIKWRLGSWMFSMR